HGSCRESIARSSNRLYEAIVPEFFERLAQTSNVHVDGALFHVDVATPDPVKELITGVNPLGVCHEELEHAVLSGAQRYGPVGHHHSMTRLVERQAFELDQLVGAVAGCPTQHSIDPGQQLTR